MHLNLKIMNEKENHKVFYENALNFIYDLRFIHTETLKSRQVCIASVILKCR